MHISRRFSFAWSRIQSWFPQNVSIFSLQARNAYESTEQDIDDEFGEAHVYFHIDKKVWWDLEMLIIYFGFHWCLNLLPTLRVFVKYPGRPRKLRNERRRRKICYESESDAFVDQGDFAVRQWKPCCKRVKICGTTRHHPRGCCLDRMWAVHSIILARTSTRTKDLIANQFQVQISRSIEHKIPYPTHTPRISVTSQNPFSSSPHVPTPESPCQIYTSQTKSCSVNTDPTSPRTFPTSRCMERKHSSLRRTIPQEINMRSVRAQLGIFGFGCSFGINQSSQDNGPISKFKSEHSRCKRKQSQQRQYHVATKSQMHSTSTMENWPNYAPPWWRSIWGWECLEVNTKTPLRWRWKKGGRRWLLLKLLTQGNSGTWGVCYFRFAQMHRCRLHRMFLWSRGGWYGEDGILGLMGRRGWDCDGRRSSQGFWWDGRMMLLEC